MKAPKVYHKTLFFKGEEFKYINIINIEKFFKETRRLVLSQPNCISKQSTANIFKLVCPTDLNIPIKSCVLK